MYCQAELVEAVLRNEDCQAELAEAVLGLQSRFI